MTVKGFKKILENCKDEDEMIFILMGPDNMVMEYEEKIKFISDNVVMLKFSKMKYHGKN